MARDSWVQNGRIRLAAREYGGEGRPLVLIHGGPGQDLATWDAFAPLLCEGMRVVALDMRGNGRSGDADDYSWPALASDIAAVVEQVKLQRPIVVGHSWGGQLATYYASCYDECRGVVGIDGWITDVHTELADDVWDWMRDDYASDPVITFAGTADDLDHMLAEVAVEYGASAAAVVRRQMSRDSDGLFRARRTVDELIHIQRAVGEAAAGLSSAIYARITCPVLLIGGIRSEREALAAREGRLGPWGFSRSATSPISERFAHVHAEWLDCGHDIPHQRADELASLIIRFCQELPA